MKYEKFLREKERLHRPCGFDISTNDVHPMLFDWQKELVRISVKRGRSALFEDCGLGKTLQQIEWSRIIHQKTGGKILILTPLAVSNQTAREASKIGVLTKICKNHDDIIDGINITNYHKLNNFDTSEFVGVVLDESSILKNFSGKFRNLLIDTFKNTPYRLCCTATPSPNDFTELGNTSEFLGVMTRPEMLSMYFINDTGNTGTWRLKGHVSDNIFWRWLSSWSVMIRKPSDIGFDDKDFVVPPLSIIDVVIPFNGERHTLFVEPAESLSDRREARKESLSERVSRAAEIINTSEDTWIAWCNLNDESAALAESINGSVEVKGSDDPDYKSSSMLDFADGKIKCLVSKPSIAGLGMNFQSCHNVVFVGLSDSFEQYYQAIRRCWRFGQKNTVNAYIITGEREGNVVTNIRRKEKDMESMFDGMVSHMKSMVVSEISRTERIFTSYEPSIEMVLPKFMEMA